MMPLAKEEESADDDVRPLVQIALLFVPFNREVHFSFRIVRPWKLTGAICGQFDVASLVKDDCPTPFQFGAMKLHV